MNETNPIRYCLYARKSSESDDRQMASVDDQIDVMTKFAKERGIIIHDIIQESKSAKKPGRQGFAELTQRIMDGEATGILTWRLNRLARNPVDGGLISWLLQEGQIEHIQTHHSGYKPSDNVLMMQLEFGMANQFSKDLSVDVKRGLNAKATRGWFPVSRLPIGYIHNPSFKKEGGNEIIPHPVQFKIMKRVWERFLTGQYSLAEITRIARLAGLKTVNGRAVSRTVLHYSLCNPFYYGEFKWRNKDGEPALLKGKHKPMISKPDFLQARRILKGHGGRPQYHSVSGDLFSFKGIFSCGECGCSITAEIKQQARCEHCKRKFSIRKQTKCPKCDLDITEMNSPELYNHTYYRCTKRKAKCRQPYINASHLDIEIDRTLKKIALPDDAVALFQRIFESELNTEFHHDSLKELRAEQSALQDRKNRLIDMRENFELERDEYLTRSEKIVFQLKAIQKQISYLECVKADWKTEVTKTINIAKEAQKLIKKGTKEEKRELLLKLGSNLNLIDKSLVNNGDSLLFGLISTVEEAMSRLTRFEPIIIAKQSPYLPDNDPENEVFFSLCTQLSEVRTKWIEKRIKNLDIPDD